MKAPQGKAPDQPASLHPRNRHSGRYDLEKLSSDLPELSSFIFVNQYGNKTIDFADPDAVLALNKALLRHYYGISGYSLPAGYLCPPIPGRADYIHHLADLVSGDQVTGSKPVRMLDIGTGANCIYPLIGHAEYGWAFVASETDAMAMKAARQNVEANAGPASFIEIRRQPDPDRIFRDIIKDGECFAACLCNPPFYSSADEAAENNQRKTKNLGLNRGRSSGHNFGGRTNELVYKGGETGFIGNMIRESPDFRDNVGWFTSLVSRESSLPDLYRKLRKAGPAQIRTVPMAQGNKKSRFIAWTFRE